MTDSNVAYLSDDSSEDEDTDFDTTRASLSEYETNRASLSDFESNRLSFTGSEHDTPFSDPESNKEYFEFNDNHQAQSESNSEEESRQQFEPSKSSNPTEKVTFYKYGQPTKVIHKPSSSTSGYSSQSVHSSKRSRSTDSEDLDDGPAARKTKYDDLAKPATAEAQSFDKAKAMMEKMGYKEGRGLGKNAQGRVAPVELSKQRGRRGLGLNVPGLEPADLTWDHSMEVVKVEEEPTWLVGDHLPSLPLNILKSWKKNGPKNLNIEECTDFCDPSVLSNILSKKSIFDTLEGEEMRRARTRSNPFETIGKGMFLNRAAMKMANMDRVFDFMFTSPKTQTGEPVVKKDELLYFADVCAGPGGFSEYVLWRKKWRSKGFGFTLRGENDFKLSDFFAGPCESFEPFYGVKEDGDVFDPANIESLMHFVMDSTQQIGVHFMMADGGFSVDGQENIQELLSKQLYLCQFLVALCIVRTGGHFVCKLFDVFSPFSVGLVYLMYRSFERISIHKPNTSRPANSERYIICKWKRDDCEPTRQYLFDLNKELCKLGSLNKEDINYCVSIEELTQDRIFFDYIVESNNCLGERQVVNLVKIAAFCRDMNLTELKQTEIRRQCLAYWNVPDMTRKVDRTTAEEIASKQVQKCGSEFLTSKPTEFITEEQLENVLKSVYDWFCVPIASHQDHNFFIGLGRNRVYRLATGGQFWKRVEGNGLELSPGTMVYGELVREVGGENKSQVKKMAFHIMDAISLGDEDITHLHYPERLKLCTLFAESLYKTTRKDLFRIRSKQLFPLEDITHLFQSLTVMKMKSNLLEMLLKTDQDEFAFQPKGVMFFKATKDPWMRHLSRSHNVCYYAKPGSASLFDKDRPADACASTKDCLTGRHIWLWKEGAGLHKEKAKEGVLHMDQLLRFLNHRLQRR